jgi:drug/metabolite transporter (DMT)-like permease
MQYNDLILFAFGLGGILIHNLTKINELLRNNKFNPTQYFSLEWASISISVILVILAIFGKHEVKQLDAAGKWLGLAFTAIGYMGQSIFVKLMGRANKVISDK